MLSYKLCSLSKIHQDFHSRNLKRSVHRYSVQGDPWHILYFINDTSGSRGANFKSNKRFDVQFAIIQEHDHNDDLTIN